MNLDHTYRTQAGTLRDPAFLSEKRSTGWRSPSNIALIKYWGKMEGQFPRNPSLSFTLDRSCTETFIDYSFKGNDGPGIRFLFDGERNEPFEKRVVRYVKTVTDYLPFLQNLDLEIRSSNSFPHSSGIASSASSMSALALCLVDIEHDLFKTQGDPVEFYRKAAFLARLGSGSATRSVYGGFVVWGKTPFLSGTTDETGISWEVGPESPYQGLRDAILITGTGQKKISSSQGHGMMEGHPWAEARYRQAEQNLEKAMRAIKDGNDSILIGIIENEALSLHALMLSSDPGYRLMNQNTWEIIERVREFREETGIFVTFTLDAGPNVHLIYLEKDMETIKEFIRKRLLKYCDNDLWIDDAMGAGPQKLNIG